MGFIIIAVAVVAVFGVRVYFGIGSDGQGIIFNIVDTCWNTDSSSSSGLR